MKPFYEIVKRPLVTEKAVDAHAQLGRYSFAVSLNASKPSIREAIENYFQVKVVDVHTMIMRGKVRRMGRHQGRQSNWKKAIVTLAQGQKLDIFETK